MQAGHANRARPAVRLEGLRMATLSLKQISVVARLADVLYDFLPGSGNAAWKSHVNFRTIAARVGVGEFCQPGSKLPMITTLLQLTLEQRPHLFDPLIIQVIRAAIPYRLKQSRPIR